MLDSLSIDQLRTFIAAAGDGSFSAAGRRLGRSQSVVSQTIANLEGHLGVKLFERTGHKPILTRDGRALLEEARNVTGSMDRLKARARGLAGGLEPELSIVVDVMFPIADLTAAVEAFRMAFPDTPLRLHVEALGAVIEPILDGRCAFGVMGSLPEAPVPMTTERISEVVMIAVASPHHPLAAARDDITDDTLFEHVQLVLTDRSKLTTGKEFGVVSSKTWRLADLGAKHAFLKAGLGWGGMPLHLVEADIANGLLVALEVRSFGARSQVMPMSAVYPADTPPGPAGRWMIERLKSAGVVGRHEVGEI
ncbi:MULTISPECIES: LysR family transcriptional regulator [unclassified Aureimonas]|uniref:LysR family transcriptional regulator n=1 Tax=unclassified Aureimonas TaxID=2615206 RepID=UPI0006F4F54E|nr:MULTISPECIES: LysR family transcriptional regulator [unclassified Aureimonas]KQT52289.1 LysR family transcriptional regulator [Aureimonas sp. Leaf427]KQT61825.1 LysR family transcriptional regulator [Aureimonas sp. Leaf460]